MDKDYSDLLSKFSSYLAHQRNGKLASFLSILEEKEWDAYFFGGVPRAALSEDDRSPRDFDIVFSDESFAQFSEYAEALGGSKNRFGGYKLDIDGEEIDAWSLSDTWAFRQNEVTSISFENLQKTVPFNVDSILVEIFPRTNERNIYCSAYIHAIENGILDVVLKENPFPTLCLVRALRFSHLMNLRWSKSVFNWMGEILEETSAAQIDEAQRSHYHTVYYDDSYFNRLRRLIKNEWDDGTDSFSPPRPSESLIKRRL